MSAPGSTLPQGVLVGVPRSGTTSLYRYFRQHPGFCLSDVKEINFLSFPGDELARERYPWLRFQVRTLAEYQELFAAADGRVAVDFSASCYRSPVAIERIERYVPTAKLFVLLRDPVARAYSAYLNRLNKGYETRAPQDALVAGEPAVDNGFYAERLTAFRDAFGAERVRAWLFEDLSADPGKTLREMFGYLGVDPDVAIDTTEVYNRGGVPRSTRLQRMLPAYRRRRQLADALPPALRSAAQRLVRLNRVPPPALPEDVAARLRALYAADVARLADVLDRDLSRWLPR